MTRWLRNHFVLIIACTAIWCLLNNSITIPVVLMGFVISFFSSILMDLLLKGHSFRGMYSITLFGLIRYMIVTVIAIYKSAFMVSYQILTGKMNPQFVTVITKTRRPFIKSLIGNAITLTPGTVTIDINNKTYTVLWNYPTAATYLGKREALILPFEEILKREDFLHGF